MSAALVKTMPTSVTTPTFVKMNGAGNDCVIVLQAGQPFRPTLETARAIADRQTGIGCDQLIGLEASQRADAFMRIWNADGGEVEACGNAARCVASLLLKATERDHVTIDSRSGVLRAHGAGQDLVSIDMGAPGLDWRAIPLARRMDTRELDLSINAMLRAPGAVSMGNPHVVFFVAGAPDEAVREMGPIIENHPLFPERVNVGFAQILARDRLRLRVWERGAGLTKACGTGACAAVVAAYRRGLTDRRVTVIVDGGLLTIAWRESDNHVIMTGPAVLERAGALPAELTR